MAKLISGKLIAEDLLIKIKNHTAKLSGEKYIKPGLAVILVGTDPASQIYVASKERKALECGFHSVQHILDRKTPEDNIIALIHKLNADPAIHGILVQLPLPQQIREERIIQAIAPQKDVDGFHYINVGKVATGNVENAFVPCTPAGAMLMIERFRARDLSGLDAVVIGRSNIVGKPMASLLLAANATVTIAHSKTKALDEVCRSADILVSAVGKPQFIRGNWIKKGATIIDVGINRVAAPDKGEGKTRIVGDVNFEEAETVADAITPVPGGVGLMTIAMLMANTLKAACWSIGIKPPKL